MYTMGCCSVTQSTNSRHTTARTLRALHGGRPARERREPCAELEKRQTESDRNGSVVVRGQGNGVTGKGHEAVLGLVEIGSVFLVLVVS